MLQRRFIFVLLWLAALASLGLGKWWSSGRATGHSAPAHLSALCSRSRQLVRFQDDLQGVHHVHPLVRLVLGECKR